MERDSAPTQKVVFIDWGLFLHRAVFGWNTGGRTIPAVYTCLNMIISCLKSVGLDPDDRVIVAIDGRGNWRRDADPDYKANRKDLKAKSGIDWSDQYRQFDNLVEKLKESTPFHFIRIDKLEADDIIAVGCKFYKENPCVIISSDSDFEQLYAFPNVKIFSPVSKKYKEVLNPYKILASKIEKETTDNLTKPITNAQEYAIRKMLVSLIDLPAFVSEKVVDKLENLEYYDYDLTKLPFKSLQTKFMEIYNSKKIVPIKKIQKKRKGKKKNVIQSGPQII